MAIDDLPGPVVNFLNVIGVPWPYIDEDTVSQFGTPTRQFGQAAQTTHQEATQSISGLDWSNASGTSGSSTGFALDAAAVRTQVASLRTQAQTMRSHGQTFRQGVRGLNF